MDCELITEFDVVLWIPPQWTRRQGGVGAFPPRLRKGTTLTISFESPVQSGDAIGKCCVIWQCAARFKGSLVAGSGSTLARV
jgi:hypothetical protein